MFTQIDNIPDGFEIGMDLDREFGAENPERRHWVRPATDAEVEVLRTEEVLSVADHENFVWRVMVCQVTPNARVKTLFCGFIPAGAKLGEEEARRLCLFLTGLAA
jgi:hypothetical protein